MQSHPFRRYLVPPRSNYSPQHHVLKHPQLPFLPQCQRDQVSHPYKTPGKIIILYILIFNTHTHVRAFVCVCGWERERERERPTRCKFHLTSTCFEQKKSSSAGYFCTHSIQYSYLPCMCILLVSLTHKIIYYSTACTRAGRAEVRIPTGKQNFCLVQQVQTALRIT